MTPRKCNALDPSKRDVAETGTVAASTRTERGIALAPAAADASQSRSKTAPAIYKKLNAKAFAETRAQLIQEIQALPENELQPQAVTILKAKNRLLTENVKLVEAAFARITLEAAPKTPEKPASTPEPARIVRCINERSQAGERASAKDQRRQ
jgi:hypothetical protein